MKNRQTILSKITIFLIILGSLFSLLPTRSEALVDQDHYPKLANHYLDWDLTDAKIQELSKWDVVTVSAGAYTNHPELVRKLKQLNPDVTLFIYVVTNEVANWAMTLEEGNLWKETYLQVNSSDWWLYTSQRQKISTWPGADWINLSSAGKTINGQQFSDWLAQKTATRFLQDDLFDGVFYDNVFDDLSWIGSDVDINNDGQPDSIDVINARWQEGESKLIAATRTYAPNKLIMANSKSNFYNGQLNGKYREHFPGDYYHGWKEEMEKYINNQLAYQPKLYLINSNNNNVDNQLYDLRKFRFTYGSTLLGNGYFHYSAGDQTHGSRWWFDEYNINLGKPNTSLVNILDNTGNLGRGVWMREYENGVVYVNTTETKQTVDLNFDLEKIKGTQDPVVNNGAIVRKIYLNPDDALVLQKRINKVQGGVFLNGSFVRPFNKDGQSLDRNGFFLFNNRFSGSQLIEEVDLNGDGLNEYVESDNSKVVVHASDYSTMSVIYPFGGKYKSGISFSVGDANGDGVNEIVVASGKGAEPMVKFFTITGEETLTSFVPFPKWFRGGISVAFAELGGGAGKEILITGKTAAAPQVKVYNNQGKMVGIFTVYDKNYYKGINVTAADLDGNGIDEIITGTAYGSAPLVKIFNERGRMLTPAFFAADSRQRKGVQVFTSDIDNDGKAEILTAVPTF